MREEKNGWKNYIGIVLACLLVGMMCEGFVSADRGMISTSDVSVYGPGQKAIIAWNGEEELLILSTDVYTSESSPVLGILPLPSNPKAIKEGNFDSFTQIENLIRNKARFGPGINITLHEKIGAHDITVVEVNDVHEFIQWAENYLKAVSVTTGARPNSPPTNGILVPTKAEPQPAGTSITWVAYAEDPDGDTLYYRFWIRGPSTGYSWAIMQDWSTDNTWTWHTASADIGDTDISVWIWDGHHAPPDRYDIEKKYYDYNIKPAENKPPTNGILVPTKGEPQPASTSITWVAYAEDPDGDTLYYRFWIRGSFNWIFMADNAGLEHC